LSVIKHTFKRIIALISDTHIGSRYALWLPEYETEEGNVLKANKGQCQIYEGWVDFCKKCDEMNVDTVIHLGDALHGTNRKEFGRNLMTSELDIQMDVAEQLLKMIVKDRQFIIITGSGYHESLDTKVHKNLAKALNGNFGGAMCNWHIKGTNRKMNMAHGVSGAVVYQTTVMDKESVQLLQAQALGKLVKFDIVARAHWHFAAHLHQRQQHFIQVPCWMAWEPSKPYLGYYGRKQPDIGAYILLIDEEDRIHVWDYKYATPHIADAIKYF